MSTDLQAHLIHLEQELVAAQKRRDFATVEALLADDFHEIGSSGRVFSKADTVRVISEVQIIDCTFDHFQFLPVDDKGVIVMHMGHRPPHPRRTRKPEPRPAQFHLGEKGRSMAHSFIRQPLCQQFPEIRKLRPKT